MVKLQKEPAKVSLWKKVLQRLDDKNAKGYAGSALALYFLVKELKDNGVWEEIKELLSEDFTLATIMEAIQKLQNSPLSNDGKDGDGDTKSDGKGTTKAHVGNTNGNGDATAKPPAENGDGKTGHKSVNRDDAKHPPPNGSGNGDSAKRNKSIKGGTNGNVKTVAVRDSGKGITILSKLALVVVSFWKLKVKKKSV